MPAEPNKTLRIAVPIVVLIAAIAIVVGIGIGARSKPSPPVTPTAQQTPVITPPATPPAAEQGAVAGDTQTQVNEPSPSEGAGDADPAASIAPPTPLDPRASLAARVWTGDAPTATLGSLDSSQGFELEIELTSFGAGIAKATATNHYETVEDRVRARRNPGAPVRHYVIQQIAEQPGVRADGTLVTFRMSALGITAATINGQRVELFGGSYGRVWELVASDARHSEWKAEIVDQTSGATVAHLRRMYTLEPGTFDLAIEQSIENVSGAPLTVVWEQFGALDLPHDTSGYKIPLQRVRFGYTLASRQSTGVRDIHSDGVLTPRTDVFNRIKRAQRNGIAPTPEWPSPRFEDADQLIWAAQTNRYFMAAVHGLPASPGVAASPLAIGASITGAALWDANTRTLDGDRLALRMSSPAFELAPGGSQSLDVGFYPAPIDERRLRDGQLDPRASAAELHDIVVFNMGGMCAWCTFPWLAAILMWILRFFDSITGDWAISIILLVVCVRAILHPIFKRSQIGIQRFGKQMQRIAPKQKKLQEKYRDDPKRLHAEIRKLMREEGVSYTGLLGCLPMFLQSPIWIALYAMLYLSFDLRHEPAFFGVFQMFGGWTFLADLSRGDGFIPLPFSFDVPLMGTISSFNILPLLLGVVFYVHQKYLTPPPSASMTPEQETQQKIVKVMMVVMFPVFMYNAPAALSLYFVTNSALGIVEGRWIRAHMDAMDLERAAAGPDDRKTVANTAGAKPSLEDRIRARLEAKHRSKQ